MPLPWKKKKGTRISQIVADLQSPKRGGSLVVETGFPTSLIDLVVKNRDRFKVKKPKTKKRVQLQISDPVRLTTPSTLSPPPSPTLLISVNHMVVGVEPGCTESQSSSSRRLVGEVVARVGDYGVEVSGEDRIRVEDCIGGSDVNTVVVSVLKIFVVFVLTFCTKKLTVGITMSAFVLLFLEYLGKRCVSWLNLKPCLDSNMELKSLAQRVSNFVWFKNLVLLCKKIKNFEGSESSLIVSDLVYSTESSSSSSSFSNEEVEIVERKFNTEIEILECEIQREIEIVEIKDNSLEHELDILTREKRWSCLKLEDSQGKVLEDSEISVCKNKGNRNAKIKAKIIKKILPKNFRPLKKEKKSKGRESESRRVVWSNIEEYVPGSCQKEEENMYGPTPTLLSPIEQRCEEEDDAEEEVDDGTSCSNGSSAVGVEVTLNGERKDSDTDRNWGYLFLFLIVLCGLAGGRIAALLLTVAWCFMLKMIETRKRPVKCL
ncbi:Ethylene-responsive nuclear / ethylene-regulated nuclear protein (ERT2)-like protein [Quillaja saponaria]|uniref:Ethylene-responsive nuclear / ethylene-regulated nuclear protein (ERT2)-like protein n=1 Tax=Quillaja saponaria TaxID=32244 RepID=A0AAD7PVU2_QUISA|nr:Ethylene-responsive nuclear / ethylene-regulated nuclear protein (ERT2)-like protein [Quillaja saponaria]